MKKLIKATMIVSVIVTLTSFKMEITEEITVLNFMESVKAGVEFKFTNNQIYSLKSQKDENGKYMKEKIWKDLGEGYEGKVNKQEKQIHTNTYDNFEIEVVSKFPRLSDPLFDISLEPEHAVILEKNEIVKISGESKEGFKNIREVYFFESNDKILFVMHHFWGYKLDKPRTLIFGEVVI